MTRVRLALMIAVAVALASIATISADVKTQERSQVKFEGMLGRVMGLFGGKAAKEGVTSTVAVKGDRMMRVTDTSGELIDLAGEKLYTVDFRSKSYKVQTFAEIRKQMEEQMRKAKEDVAKSEGRKEPSREEPQMEIEFSAKETGQRKTINGFDCRQVISTILVHEKGKKIEDSGGLVLTADSWVAPKNPALQEIQEFNVRYFKAIQTPGMMDAAQGMAQALAMYPGLGDALQRMQNENASMDGTPILTTVTIESQQNAQQTAQSGEQEQPKPSGGIGGMLGGLGRLKRSQKTDENPAPAGAAKGRSTFMTTVNEVLGVTPDVSDADVSIPAGFKQK
jgi:hypothetical protein